MHSAFFSLSTGSCRFIFKQNCKYRMVFFRFYFAYTYVMLIIQDMKYYEIDFRNSHRNFDPFEAFACVLILTGLYQGRQIVQIGEHLLMFVLQLQGFARERFWHGTTPLFNLGPPKTEALLRQWGLPSPGPGSGPSSAFVVRLAQAWLCAAPLWWACRGRGRSGCVIVSIFFAGNDMCKIVLPDSWKFAFPRFGPISC